MELDLSKRSQSPWTNLLHTVKLGLNVVMRKLEELVSFLEFCGILSVNSSLYM